MSQLTETKSRKAFRSKSGDYIWLSCSVEIGRFTKRRTYKLEDKVGHLYAEAIDDKSVKTTAKAREKFGNYKDRLQEIATFLDKFRINYDKEHPRKS